MPSRYQKMYNRSKAFKRKGLGRRLFFDNNVVMSPAAQGRGARMPIRGSIRTGGRRLMDSDAMVIAESQDTTHGTKRERDGSYVTNRGQPTSTRQTGTVTSQDDIDLRNLEVRTLKWPSQGSDLGNRLGTTIKVSGFKVCEQFTNTQAYPIVIHYAIIQKKNTGQASLGVNSSFFRDNLGDNAEGRGRDFVDLVPLGDEPYDFAYDCFAINPDLWNVVMHKKRVLAAENTDVNWAWDTWKFDEYVNMKGKVFSFNKATDTSPNQPLLKVFWWQPLRAQDWADPAPGALPTIGRQSHECMYFRNGFS